MTTFTTSSGVELDLVPVSEVGLRNLMFGSGALRKAFTGAGNTSEIMQQVSAKLTQDEAIRLGQDGVRLYNYICSYGGTNDPPDEALEELAAIGYELDNPRVARMRWLQLLVLTDEDSKNLLGEIIKLSNLTSISVGITCIFPSLVST